MTLSEQVAKIEKQLEDVSYLCDEIITTLQLNVIERKTVKSVDDIATEYLVDIVNGWTMRFRRIAKDIKQ